MNSLKYVFSAGLVLAMALVFSCSSGGGGGGDSNNEFAFCVYKDLEQCVAGLYKSCPAGGQPRNSCPKNYELFVGDGSGATSAYCVYADGCLEGSFSSCIKNGELSNTCPHDNLAGGDDGDKPGPGGDGGNEGGDGNITPGTNGPVAVYGELKACKIGTKGQLCGSKTGWTSKAVQVRGVSLFWSNTDWGGDAFFNAATVNAMVDSWKAEVIRVPIGYDEGGALGGGYRYDPSNLTRVKTAVKAAIEKGVYVIIDWHSHNAHNEKSAAEAFFKEMASTYGKYDNVIFEIYNEPLEVSWSTIKDYAEPIISAIRTYSNNLILVGTPNWCQNVNAMTSSPLADNNVAYVLHFYAYSHSLTGTVYGSTTTTFQSATQAVLNAGYPVFVSEYGTTHSDGGCNPNALYSDCKNGNQYGSHNATAANAWHIFMDDNKISSAAWNVGAKHEASAFFGTGNSFTQSVANFKNTNMMTPSGAYIYGKLTEYAASAPWRSSSGEPGGGGGGYFCDWGYPSTGGAGGCVEIDDPDVCNDGYGMLVSNCTTGRRTDLIYCDWGPRVLNNGNNCGTSTDTYCGGCYQTASESVCISQSGSPKLQCPASSI